jgi:membrane peptidoglycan carboxypeptidase
MFTKVVKKVVKFFFFFGFFAAVAALSFGVAVFLKIQKDSFDPRMIQEVSKRIETIQKETPSQILWEKGEFKQYVGKVETEKLDLKSLPQHLIAALLAAEHADFKKAPPRFWKTKGCSPINLRGKGRILYGLLKYRKVLGGGSGIPEQLSKNLIAFKREKRIGKLEKVRQKLMEISRAWHLCRQYSPEDILWLYLKTAAFIPRDRYGITAGCFYQFGKPCSELTAYESTDLVLNLPNPTKFNVHRTGVGIEKIRAGRRAYVLKQMRQKFGLAVQPHPLTYKNNLRTSVSKNEDMPFLEAVIQELVDRGFDLTPGWRVGGYKIVLTTDQKSHSSFKEIVTHQFNAWNEWLGTDSSNPVSGAVVISNHKGEILFWWGGGDFVDRTNRVYHPGSVPKYLALIAGRHYPKNWPVYNGENFDESGIPCTDLKDKGCVQTFSYRWEGKMTSVKNDHHGSFFITMDHILPESANVASTVLLVHSHLLLSDEEFNKQRLVAMNWALQQAKHGCRLYKNQTAEEILENKKLHFKFLRDCYGLQGNESLASQTQTLAFVLRKYKDKPIEDEKMKEGLAELLAKGRTSFLSLEQEMSQQLPGQTDPLTWDPEIRLAHTLRWLIALGEKKLGLEKGHQPLPSIILGGQGFTVRELATMYSCVVGGDIAPPICVSPYLIGSVRANGTEATLQKTKTSEAPNLGLEKIKENLLKTVQKGGTAASSQKILGDLANKVTFKTGTGQNNATIACAGGLTYEDGFLTISLVASRDKVKDPLCKKGRCLYGSDACKLASELLKKAAENLPLSKSHEEEEKKEEESQPPKEKEETSGDKDKDDEIPPPPPPNKK